MRGEINRYRPRIDIPIRQYAYYRAALAFSPGDTAANLAVAIYEQNHGNLPEAVQRYKAALRAMEDQDPLEQAKAYQNLAVAYRDMGDTTNSVECLRRAARLRKK